MALPEFEESGHGRREVGSRVVHSRVQRDYPSQKPLPRPAASLVSGFYFPAQFWKAQLIQKSHFNQLDEV